jgi:phosphate starvation-inducible PhoH-like protein
MIEYKRRHINAHIYVPGQKEQEEDLDRIYVHLGDGGFSSERDSSAGLLRFLSNSGFMENWSEQERGGMEGRSAERQVEVPRKHDRRLKSDGGERVTRKKNGDGSSSNGFGKLISLKPITETQGRVVAEYENGQHLLLSGTAGTGKTFFSMYLALRDILEHQLQRRLIIVRSVVQTRDMGFLPGDSKEKLAAFESPYVSACEELFGHSEAFGVLKRKGFIEFMPTSFIRGVTLTDSIVLVDEAQNMNDMELHSIITRIGQGSRLIVCGDIRQCDFLGTREKTGLSDFAMVVSKMDSFSLIEFHPEDIVRSGVVKEYIETRNRLEIDGHVRSLTP